MFAEGFAFGEMIDHVAPLLELFAPPVQLSPSMAGLEDCGGHCARARNNGAVAEECLARRFLEIQQDPVIGGLGNVYRLPGPENPADGRAKVRSDTVPMLCLLQSGFCFPGTPRPLRGVALWKAQARE